ncbi:MAG: selenide, water dikinase SelD [Thermoanaerobaculia bacterium]|nr:MAG: selenide, water dikinase SelD [Thermoanaerobaculia bacterium]MBZ0103098.1 selenide, water dikinase SelD [Thermoanaerobaculia bacterium]
MSGDAAGPFRLSRCAAAGGCAAKLGPADLAELLAALPAAPPDPRVLVDSATGDDAAVFRFADDALVATLDVIPPIGDEPRRFGRIAAANALSDVWAMGGEPLFALAFAALPADLPPGVAAAILAGGQEIVLGAGAALVGGHSIRDRELKYGLAVVGRVAPARLLTNAGARPSDRLVLTKPLGTGVLANAYRFDRLDAAGLEPALAAMERTNAAAARLALLHGARAATDVTGFGLAGHAWNLARESAVRLILDFDALPVHPRFFDLARAGVTTGCTNANRAHVEARLDLGRPFAPEQLELLFDPQTSGGLLLSTPADRVAALVADLLAGGQTAAVIGSVDSGLAGLTVR